jgi:HK97 family phage major capsid protein
MLTEKQRSLLDKRNAYYATMTPIIEKLDNDEPLTRGDRETFDDAERRMRLCDAELRATGFDPVNGNTDDVNTRGTGSAVTSPAYAGDVRTIGYPAELLRPDQSLRTHMERSGAYKSQGTDRDYNRMFAELSGLRPRTVESRTLQEDVATGAQAAGPATPADWAAQTLDLLRSETIMDRAGVTSFVMPHEVFNMPQLAADVAPTYLAENAALSLDNAPGLVPLVFNCSGAFTDVTLITRQAAEDATAGGGLDAILRNSIVERFKRVVDKVAIYGQAGATGVPGLLNEAALVSSGTASPAGFGANGGAPPTASATVTPYQQISIAAEAVRKLNAEPSAFLVNPQTLGTYARATDTIGDPAEKGADIAGIPWLDSTTLVSNEVQGTSGAVCSSIYTGDFSKMMIGWHVGKLQINVLDQLYAAQNAIGYLSYLRFSIRIPAAVNAAFYRLTGLLTT